MDLRQLRYFYTICEEGQITAAAKKLHMAQPPLSQALQALEKELGVSLMKRGTRSIQLTDAGELLKERAQQIFELCEKTKKDVNSRGTTLYKTIHIGLVSSAHSVFLQRGIQAFHQQYPHVSFRVLEGNTFQVMDMIHKGKIDIGIVRTPFVRQQVKTISLRKEGMVAVFPKAMNIPSHPITLPDLHAYPLIYYERYATLIEEIFMEYGLQPQVVCLNQDARTTMLWAKAGMGVGIVPRSACQQIHAQDITICDIQEERFITEIMLVHSKEHIMSDMTKIFLSYYQEDKEETHGNVGYL